MSEKEQVTYMEFLVPFILESEVESGNKPSVPHTMTIGINMKGRMRELYQESDWGDYPPAVEEACSELAEDLDGKIELFIKNDYIRYAHAESAQVESVEDLRQNKDEIRWIY